MTKLANSRWFWIVFAILTMVVYFSGLAIPLVGPDEPRYAQVAREMFERGDWITPTLGGFNWFEKPALLYWLQIASYNMFGVGEFAARFGSAILVWRRSDVLWLLGRTLDKDLGNLLAVIGASTLGIIVFAHGASFDIIVTFPITAAATAFFIFERRNSTLSLAMFYFFVGVALLAKGLIGIVLPIGIVSFYYLISWRLPNTKLLFSLLWGTVLALAVASVSYVPMYFTHGHTFIDEFFVQHHFRRYTSNKYLHPQPFYFFFWVLPLMTIPWLPFFLAAIVKRIFDVFQRADSDDTAQDAAIPLGHFALAWLIVPLLFFSFSGSKLPGYILPAIAPAIVITGIFIARLMNKNAVWRYPVQVIALGMLLAVYVAINFAVPSYADQESVKSLIEAADLRGFSQSRVIGYKSPSHNAEFYAAGRLFRDVDGKQLIVSDIASFDTLPSLNGPVLLLVRANKLEEVVSNGTLKTDVLGFNGKLYIVAVWPK